MSKKIYFWIEDKKGKASYQFWTSFMQELFPQVIVESKNNCSELVKATRKITDDGNCYIIAFDNSFDNLQVAAERKLLKQITKDKANVRITNMLCFEYVLLSIPDLIQWIYAPQDEFLTKRMNIIRARQVFLDALNSDTANYKELKELVAFDKNIQNYNVEKLSAVLLFSLTRNTGFEVTKSSLGPCWTTACCDWAERQSDDVCGLDESRPSMEEKMKQIFDTTVLCNELDFLNAEVCNDNNL